MNGVSISKTGTPYLNTVRSRGAVTAGIPESSMLDASVEIFTLVCPVIARFATTR